MKKIVLFLLITLMFTDNCYSQTAEDDYNSAVAKFKSGDTQLIIDDYSKALKLDHSYVTAYINRGLVKTQLSNRKGAIAGYSRALKITLNDTTVFNNRGAEKIITHDY